MFEHKCQRCDNDATMAMAYDHPEATWMLLCDPCADRRLRLLGELLISVKMYQYTPVPA